MVRRDDGCALRMMCSGEDVVRWVSCVTKIMENNLRVDGGDYEGPDDVRVAHGGFFDFGFESGKKKKWGFVQVYRH